jgi:hypothetical protein
MYAIGGNRISVSWKAVWYGGRGMKIVEKLRFVWEEVAKIAVARN